MFVPTSSEVKAEVGILKGGEESRILSLDTLGMTSFLI